MVFKFRFAFSFILEKDFSSLKGQVDKPKFVNYLNKAYIITNTMPRIMELIPETSGIIKFFLLLTIALSGLSSYTLSSTTSLTLYVQLGVNDEILCATLNVLLLY